MDTKDSVSTSVDELIRLAKEDLERNSLGTAEKALEQVILANNQLPEAFHLLGHVYTKRGKFKKAILAFQRVLQLDPLNTEAAIGLSSLYNDVGKYREGAKVFEKTKKRLERTAPGFDPRINEDLAHRHQELGTMYFRFERFEEAYVEFAKALKLEPENAAVIVQMAKCLAKAGNRNGAIDFLTSVVRTRPKSPDVKIQLGVLYHSLQKIDDAQKQWQEVLEMDPENKSAQMYLSMFD